MPAKDVAKLSTKFQICIPTSVGAKRAWQAGQVFAFVPKGEGLLLVPVPRLEDLAGIAKRATPESYRDRADRL